MLALVRPSSRNFALVSRRTARNLNFQTGKRQRADGPRDRPARPSRLVVGIDRAGTRIRRSRRLGVFRTGPASTWRLSAAMRPAMTAYCRLAGGSSVMASCQPAEGSRDLAGALRGLGRLRQLLEPIGMDQPVARRAAQEVRSDLAAARNADIQRPARRMSGQAPSSPSSGFGSAAPAPPGGTGR